MWEAFFIGCVIGFVLGAGSVFLLIFFEDDEDDGE